MEPIKPAALANIRSRAHNGLNSDIAPNVLHKGLRRFIENDDKSGIQAAVAEKLRRMISFLQDMEKEEELKTVPGWKAHKLTGERKDTWSLSVTRNWRLTFGIDQNQIEIIDLDYEDYH